MTMNRWQFSLRALLVFMTVVAAVTAFAANHPEIALLIAFGEAWVMFESGALVNLVVYLSEPQVFARHPLLASVVWFAAGMISFAVSGSFVWVLIHGKRSGPFLLQLTMALVFAGFSSYCAWLLWKSFKRPVADDPAKPADKQ